MKTLERNAVKHTAGPWGVSVLNKDIASGKPCLEGAMVVSPPPEEQLRRIRSNEFPTTSVRVAMLASSHYTPHDVCVANAKLAAAAPEMLALLIEIEESYGYMGDADNCECGENGMSDNGNLCEHRRVRGIIARAYGKT